MADPSERLDAMFPRLTPTQIARLLPVGRRRRFEPGEVIYERGSAKRAFYVLLEGRVEIASPSRVEEERVTIHETGEFTGEVDMISGRQSLVRARALDATELLEIEAAQWPLRRRPYQFETSLPRVFAVGDVRSGSMKRVASAVGEGWAALQLVHKVLAE